MKEYLHRTVQWLKSLFFSCISPSCVRTNQDTGLIKLIACICMFVDHAGKMLFPRYTVMREIGRLAFPLFAYGIAVGAVYTQNPAKYLSRVVSLALVCQPLYVVALAHENHAMYAVPFSKAPLSAIVNFYMNSWKKPSILFALALGLLIILCLRHRQWALALGVYVLCWRLSSYLDYGIHGIHLMLLFYLFCQHPAACFAAAFSFMFWWSMQGSGYTFFGIRFGLRVFSLPAVAFACLPLKRRLHLPKWFIYGFYPAHLVALIVLCR